MQRQQLNIFVLYLQQELTKLKRNVCTVYCHFLNCFVNVCELKKCYLIYTPLPFIPYIYIYIYIDLYIHFIYSFNFVFSSNTRSSFVVFVVSKKEEGDENYQTPTAP